MTRDAAYAECPYQRSRVPFTTGGATFTLTDGVVTQVSVTPVSRRDAEDAMVAKYGVPAYPLAWKNKKWLRAKAWPANGSGGYQWTADDGSIIRLGRIGGAYFLTFVVSAQYDAQRDSY